MGADACTLPWSCLISAFESVFVQVLSAGKNATSRRPGGGTELASGGCSLVASLRERRGWVPGGLGGNLPFPRAFDGGQAAGHPPRAACGHLTHTQPPPPPFLPGPPSSQGPLLA